jgi:hypothetical protein
MLDWDHQLDLIREHSTDATGAVCANKVCIISIEDGSVLTSLDQDNTFAITNEEAKTIRDAFSSNDFTTFKENGVNIEGRKFKFINATDENIVFAREQYVGTLTMQCSLTTVLVAFTLEGYNQANTNLGLREIAHYLSEKEGL